VRGTGRWRQEWPLDVARFSAACRTERRATARRYCIGSLAEARAYLAHPEIGPRVRQCVDLLLRVAGKWALQKFVSPDALKLRSSLTP